MGHRRIATVVSVLCAAAFAAVPPARRVRRAAQPALPEPAARGRNRRCRRFDGRRRQPGRDRRAPPGWQRRRRRCRDGKRARGDRSVRRRPRRRRLHGHLQRSDAHGHDDRRPRDLPVGLHDDACSSTRRPASRWTTPRPPISRCRPACRGWSPRGRRPSATYGRLSLGADLRPAIRVARRGFAVNFDFNQLEQSGLSTLQAYPASRSLLLTPSGDPLPIGTWLRNPDLAHTYELIARRGPAALYDGPIGQAIVQADDHPVLTPGQTIVTKPGIMTMKDLRSYRTRILAPTHVDYRGLSIYGMAPPSSGGSTEGEILNILSGYKLGSEPRARRCSTTSRRPGSPTPTATPTSATPTTSTFPSPGCSIRRSRRRVAA